MNNQYLPSSLITYHVSTFDVQYSPLGDEERKVLQLKLENTTQVLMLKNKMLEYLLPLILMELLHYLIVTQHTDILKEREQELHRSSSTDPHNILHINTN